MSSRQFSALKGTLESGVCHLDGYIQLTGDGYATVASLDMFGATCARTAAGTYKIQFVDRQGNPDHFMKVKGADGQFVCQANNALSVKVLKVQNGSADNRSGADSVTIATVNASGVPTDSAVGCGIFIKITVKNSDV